MAKSPTKDPAFDADDVEKLFKKSKMTGEPLPFAFGLTSKPEDCGFMAHLRRPGKTLKKELKGASKAIGKVCFGTFTVVENDILLCPDKPLKGVVKQLRVRFRKAGMGKFKPKLVGPDGAEIDEETLPDAAQFDDSEEEAAPAAAPPSAQPQAEAQTQTEPQNEAQTETQTEPPEAPDLTARLTALKARITAAGKPVAERLNNPFVAAVKQAGAGETDKALAAIVKMEAALDQLAGQKAPPKVETEAPKKPADAFKALVARLGTLDDATRKGLMPQVQAIKGKLTSGGATEAVAEIAALMQTLDAGGGGDSVLETWNSAKEAADTNINTLAKALKGYGNPALTRIAEHGITGLNGGDSYAKLTAALFDYEKSTTATRADAAKTLLPRIATYRTALLSDEMVSHWEANPLGISINIRAPLTTALDKIEAQVKG